MTHKPPKTNIDDLMRYESGDMTTGEEVRLFQTLIDNGMVWNLQGHYQRVANHYLRCGVCSPAGQRRSKREVAEAIENMTTLEMAAMERDMGCNDEQEE